MNNRIVVADRQKGFIDWAFTLVFSAIAALALSLFLSIIIEWIGIRFFWRDQGAAHSAKMYVQELSFLSGDLQRSLLADDAGAFATSLADGFEHWIWEKTRAIHIVSWIVAPPPEGATSIRIMLHDLSDYAAASVTMTKVFGVRLATLLLAAPLFLFAALIALADGFVERDLRKWGGGRESGYTFHIAKRFIAPTLTLFTVAILSAPVSVNPIYMTLPAAAVLAIAIRMTTSSFKKYL